MIVGEVRSVEKGGSQTGLVTAAATGDMTLSVEMAEGNFNEDGGQLLLNDNTYDYTSIDVDADTITLTAPLPVAASVDDPVQAVDAGTPQVEWTALVAIDDGDPVAAAIPTDKIGYFPEGVYDQAMQVAIELRGDTYEVVSQPFRDASFDGRAVWNPHAFRDMAARDVPNATYTQITGWAVGEVDGVTATSAYTIVYAGVYYMAAQAAFAGNATGARRARILVNGVQVAYSATAADAGTSTYVLTFREIRLIELDVVTVEVYQDSGATLALFTSGGVSNFAMHRVSV